MKNTDGKAALAERTGASTAYADKETPSRSATAVREEKQAAEKPHASKEIVIEEISIDGMCGVY